MSDRLEVIEGALGQVFKGVAGSTVEYCSKEINQRLDQWIANGEDVRHRLHMLIWNWYPAGATDTNAAGVVYDALQESGHV